MRKFIILLALATLFTFAFSSCDDSKKGAWSDSKKKEFMDGCIGGLEGQSTISEEQGKKICQCALDKLEAQAAPSDVKEADAEKAGADCATKIMFGGN